jgi:hypothetical protein
MHVLSFSEYEKEKLNTEPKKDNDKKNRRGERTEWNLTTSKSSSLLAGDDGRGSTDRSGGRGWLLSAGSTGEEKGRVE